MTKILVTDDSRSIRQMVGDVLRSAGHIVLEAENGQIALDTARGCNLDLVISDLNMPVMDGLTFIKQLRGLREHRKTPILMFTTESQLSRKEEAKAVGATGWIVKPMEPKRLLQVVEHVLSRQTAAV